MIEAPALQDRSPFWLDSLADLWPERVAVIDPDHDVHYTIAELRRRALSVAATLAARGIRRGDRVAAIMHNGVVMLDLLFACARLGAILVPINWRLSERETAHILGDTEPAVLVYGSEFENMAAAGGSSIQLLGELDLWTDGDEAPEADTRMPDPWLILYTGGTTGTPKGAVLTHSSIAWNAINTAISWGLCESDVAPNPAPMFHTGGWNVFTLPILMLGGRVILPQRFDPGQMLAIIEQERPTVLFLVPTMFQLVAEQPGFAGADLSSLRWVISGGAPLPQSVIDLWQGKVRIFKQGYGLTEVGPNNFATPDEDAERKRGTVGRLTFFARARIVDEQGLDLPVGEAGELLLAGPHMCAGYWRRPEATADAIRQGWFHTGDIARCDDEGYYYIVDRKKDMIITGGENVYPTEVEAVLYAHPAVREAAVVGLPDPLWGEAICAVVSFKAGHSASEDELRAHMRSALARYKVPKRFLIVADLPKSAAGKIVRVEAQKLAAEHP